MKRRNITVIILCNMWLVSTNLYSFGETRTGLRKDIEKAKKEIANQKNTSTVVINLFKTYDDALLGLMGTTSSLAKSVQQFTFNMTIPDAKAKGWQNQRVQVENRLEKLSNALPSLEKSLTTLTGKFDALKEKIKNIKTGGILTSRKYFVKKKWNEIIPIHISLIHALEKTIENIKNSITELKDTFAATEQAKTDAIEAAKERKIKEEEERKELETTVKEEQEEVRERVSRGAPPRSTPQEPEDEDEDYGLSTLFDEDEDEEEIPKEPEIPDDEDPFGLLDEDPEELEYDLDVPEEVVEEPRALFHLDSLQLSQLTQDKVVQALTKYKTYLEDPVLFQEVIKELKSAVTRDGSEAFEVDSKGKLRNNKVRQELLLVGGMIKREAEKLYNETFYQDYTEDEQRDLFDELIGFFDLLVPLLDNQSAGKWPAQVTTWRQERFPISEPEEEPEEQERTFKMEHLDSLSSSQLTEEKVLSALEKYKTYLDDSVYFQEVIKELKSAVEHDEIGPFEVDRQGKLQNEKVKRKLLELGGQIRSRAERLYKGLSFQDYTEDEQKNLFGEMIEFFELVAPRLDNKSATQWPAQVKALRKKKFPVQEEELVQEDDEPEEQKQTFVMEHLDTIPVKNMTEEKVLAALEKYKTYLDDPVSFAEVIKEIGTTLYKRKVGAFSVDDNGVIKNENVKDELLSLGRKVRTKVDEIYSKKFYHEGYSEDDRMEIFSTIIEFFTVLNTSVQDAETEKWYEDVDGMYIVLFPSAF